MRILALDLGTNCGWAAWGPDLALSVGARHFAPGAGLGVFCSAFDRWLGDKLEAVSPQIVCFEETILAPRSGIGSRKRLFGMEALTELACYRRFDTVCASVSISTWRKHFIGTTRGGRDKLKALAIQECERRGVKVRDDNAADAFGLLDYFTASLELKTPWPRTALEAA